MNNNSNLISKAKKFYENKNFFEAKKYLLKSLKNDQMEKMFRLRLYVLISDICYKINDFESAEKYLLKSIEGGISNSDIFNSLGNIYLRKRDYKNSEKFYLKAVNFEEKNETALINLAILYHNLGKYDEAIVFYKKVLKKNPKNIGVLYNLSKIDKSVSNEKNVKNLKTLINKNSLDNFNLASSYFLLAKIEENKKNFKEEINLLEKANNLSFKTNEKKNLQFDKYWLHSITKKFDKLNSINNVKSLSNVNNLYPIFIIGLPRCGSTLIESIISSGNDRVQNLGETNLVNWAFVNSNEDFIKSFNKKELIKIDLNETSKRLLNAIKNLGIKKDGQKNFFSEKSLENFYYIELILNIFPKAKFIHPYRDLTDNVLAIYKQFLPSISWAHSIENILLYTNNYLFTIDYFKKKYPKKIFSISLENLTNNPKNYSKKIYDFCDLKWSKDCLNFYKRNDLFINTASNNQIRGNIKKYDNDRYKPYKEILKIYSDKYTWLQY